MDLNDFWSEWKKQHKIHILFTFRQYTRAPEIEPEMNKMYNYVFFENFIVLLPLIFLCFEFKHKWLLFWEFFIILQHNKNLQEEVKIPKISHSINICWISLSLSKNWDNFQGKLYKTQNYIDDDIFFSGVVFCVLCWVVFHHPILREVKRVEKIPYRHNEKNSPSPFHIFKQVKNWGNTFSIPFRIFFVLFLPFFSFEKREEKSSSEKERKKLSLSEWQSNK